MDLFQKGLTTPSPRDTRYGRFKNSFWRKKNKQHLEPKNVPKNPKRSKNNKQKMLI